MSAWRRLDGCAQKLPEKFPPGTGLKKSLLRSTRAGRFHDTPLGGGVWAGPRLMKGELFDPHFLAGLFLFVALSRIVPVISFPSPPFFMFWRIIFFITSSPLSAAHKFAAQGGVVVRVVVCVCVAVVIVLCCCFACCALFFFRRPILIDG